MHVINIMLITREKYSWYYLIFVINKLLERGIKYGKEKLRRF